MNVDRRLAARLALLATVAAFAPACGEAEDDEPFAASTDALRGPHPRLAHLPDVTGLAMGGCANVLGGCSLVSTNGKNPVREARRIYDATFVAKRPTSDAGWGWKPATADERAMLAAAPPILPLPTGAQRPDKDAYKAWMSLQPDPWGTLERRKELAKPSYTRPASLPFARRGVPDGEKNLAILGKFAGDEARPFTDPLRARYYEAQNPFDWQGAAMTHYQPPSDPSGADIMASNFVWRVLLAPWQMEQALADCNADPAIPCIETVAVLSDVDLYKVYDVRFVRPATGGQLEISRTFRVVSVDSGHAVDVQSTFGPGATNVVTGAPTPERRSTPMLKTFGDAGPRLLWRLEVGGQLARTLDRNGGGAIPGLVRFAANNGRTPADRPAAGACTDVNDGEWKCIDDAGKTKTVKCMGLLWQTYTSGCRIPGR